MGLDDFRRAIEARLGSDRVLDADDKYLVDWTGRYRSERGLVVRPRSTTEVQALVRLAIESRVNLVPQGGNTGLVGGGVPHHGEVVVSLESMRAVGEVDRSSRQIEVEAGATLQSVQEAAEAVDLRYPVDFGARGSATIGGTIATNAGGINVLRYGMTRQQMVGVEAVLGNGEIVSHLSGLVKDNTGYDLGSLLCGSEGTLGIVTKARLRLVPNFARRSTFLIGVPSLSAAMDCVSSLVGSLDTLDAVELMTNDGVSLVTRTIGVEAPLRGHAVYLLIETSSDVDQTEAIGAHVADRPGLRIVAAATATQRRDLWRLRDEHTPSINSLGPPSKFDVTVRPSAIPEFVPAVEDRLRRGYSGSRLIVFGHAADGNLHVNVLGVEPGEFERLGDDVLSIVSSFGGSVSAEHGIGVAKKRWLHLSRTPSEIAAMRAVKAALDPFGIMNPNVLFD